MKITYFGHSAFLVENQDCKALIDPFIKDNPHIDIDPSEFKNITHIFVTHGHGDHLGDTEEIGKKSNALVISNAEIANYLSPKGLNTYAMHIGGRTTLDSMIIKMTPALHGSGIPTENGMIEGGNPGGFIIEMDGKKIYHAGDTGLSMEMKLLERENIDIALLPIGGNFTMDIEDAIVAVEFIKPKMVIPMHYKTFPVLKGTPEEFREKLTDVEVKILDPGQSFKI